MISSADGNSTTVPVGSEDSTTLDAYDPNSQLHGASIRGSRQRLLRQPSSSSLSKPAVAGGTVGVVSESVSMRRRSRRHQNSHPNGSSSSSSSSSSSFGLNTCRSWLHSPNVIPYIFISVFVVVVIQLTMNSLMYSSSNNNNTLSIKTPNFISSWTTRFHGHQQPIISSNIQSQLDDIHRRIENLESTSKVYVNGYDASNNEYASKFFPFVIRDSRHLVPTQTSSEFHILDYVDVTQAKQARARHSQLFHNAHLINNAPCQKYTIQCYRQKIIQVFTYVLKSFPTVEYYFYVEADNDLCVPMAKVRDLALSEQRYFINTGIGFSGWIMSRQFMTDFLEIYQNASSARSPNPASEELRPDVIASYYLTERNAWTVTRQYWVSHTTLESLGAASLTVKDTRSDVTGTRLKLEKHLPRCLEPRRGKWKMSMKPLDPRDRFGWDYFDYDVCPKSLLFPCGGPNQLAELVAEDWSIANATGALARAEQIEAANAAGAGTSATEAKLPNRHVYYPGGRNRERGSESQLRSTVAQLRKADNVHGGLPMQPRMHKKQIRKPRTLTRIIEKQ